jgi:hypothetical protein
MASSVDPSQEGKLKDILEDLDTYRYIYDDLIASRGDCEEADELQETIKGMEAQVAALLSDSVPTPQAAPAAPAPQVPSTTPPVLAPTPATPRVPSTTFTGIPGVSFASPHWPSDAPSPFAAESRLPPILPASPSESSSDNHRKRPRPLSDLSPTTQGSSKRNAPSQPEPRRTKLDMIEAEQKAQLDKNDRLFKGWMDEAGDDADQLKSLQEEHDENVQLIETEFQFKRDAELARVLQADEDKNRFRVDNSKTQNTWKLPDRAHPVKVEPHSKGIYIPRPYGQYGPGTPFNGITPFSSDDDLQEIDANSFNSRFGRQPASQPGSSSYPTLPPLTSSKLQNFSQSPLAHQPTHHSHMPYGTSYADSRLLSSGPSQMFRYSQMPNGSPGAGSRTLPWKNEPAYPTMPGAYDNFDRAFDLVRNQEEIWDDDADIA